MRKAEAADDAVQRIVGLTERLLRYVNELIELSEANNVISFTEVLSSQIPRSMAAHAFNQFRAVMLRYEVLRLAACWGRSLDDDANIPSVIDALRRGDVLSSAASRLARHDSRREASYRDHLEKARVRADAVIDDPRFNSILSFRHKELAHNLRRSKIERTVAVSPVTRQDTVWLLEETQAIVEHLFHGLSAGLFDFSMSRDQARLAAQNLWYNCTFENLR